MKGLIADATGVYHDISKAAFDAYSLKHPETMKHLATKLLEQPIIQSVHELAKKAGVLLENYENISYQGIAAMLAHHVGAKFMAAGTGAAGAAALGAEAAGTGGVAVAMVAIEAAIEWAVDNWGKGKATAHEFKRGDWVIIDKGQKTIKKLDRDLDWALGEMFQDMPSISELHVLERMEDFHVGFYISRAKTDGWYTVFDLLSGQEEDKVFSDVRVLPQMRRAALDMDEFASKVRELYFTKEDRVYFECEVSCDPGTEVIFDESLWYIVSCDGYLALIENAFGDRQNVSMKVLGRSRQERIGPQHLYRRGMAREADSFVSSPGGISAGDWVWVEIGATTQELAVVHIIRGDEIFVYYTTTGELKSVPEGR